MDTLTVNVELAADGDSPDDVTGQLQREIKDYVGVTTQVRVLDPGTIPRSEGKAVRVIDQRE